MNPDLPEIVLLTLKVAAVATLVAGAPCILLGYALARCNFVGKSTLSALAGMPLVIPPTVVGVLLLRLFATEGWLGPQSLGVDLGMVLTWRGAAIASVVMSLPLFVRTARVAFEGVDPALERMARTLGFGPIETFVRFTLPMARRGVLAALVLGFTRALGEYGATVTIAGSIPGRTRTLASAITIAEQSGAEGEARTLILASLALGFASVWLAESLSTARGVETRS